MGSDQAGRMDVVEALSHLGGEASTKAVQALTSRGALRRAVASGQAVRLRPGVVALPALNEGLSAARTSNGCGS